MPSYTITQLVREFDLTSRTIRFYEDQGLLNPAREGRNRIYSPRDRTRLKLILRGKRLGLSLQEIRELMDMYESPQDTAQQLQCFLKVLDVHKQTLKQQLNDIEGMLGEIVQHEQHCESLLAAQKQTA